MKVNNWTVKDITFGTDERKKVANHVTRLLSRGWTFNEGSIVDGLAFGEEQDQPDIEVIQLIK